jgi:hypothetical protein
MTRARATLALLLAVLGATPLAAQQRSPIADLLRQASNALNDLRYGRADSIARGVLALGSRVSRNERIEALQIIVAALYPEERGAQRLEPARTYMRQLVRLAPNVTLPRSISWSGLDSLLAQTRRTTFSLIVQPQQDNIVQGDGGAPIPFLATRPARVTLTAMPDSGAPILLDSAGPTTTGAVSVRVLAADAMRLPSGRYTFVIRAIDAAAPDTIVWRYQATVIAPPLELLPVPAALDSAQLRPEVAPPARGRNIAIGVGLGALTALAATVVRADEPVASAVSPEAMVYGVGAALTAGAVLGAFMDKGTAQPQNVAWNATLRAQFAQRVRDVQDQNATRRAAYRATVTIQPEPL